VIRGQPLEQLPGLQIDGFGHDSGADLRALHVHHDRYVALNGDRDLANTCDQGGHPLAAAMSHVQAHDVQPGAYQLAELFRAFGGRTDGRDDLGVSVVVAHGVTRVSV